jgi:glutamyl-Q tRNA(Asp) synthetase
MTPVFRFAPSPNGYLHLGHALSALLNADLARQADARLLLRIEDIDATRCKPEYEAAIYEDLSWLGVEWEVPARRQSEHLADYRDALKKLQAQGLVYPSFESRTELATGERLSENERARRERSGEPYALRLDMAKAIEHAGPLTWNENGKEIPADPLPFGDVVLARKETPTSYHLSVVVDDAVQGVTNVVRGQDLYEQTSVHRVLQHLLGLRAPAYRHHHLILDNDGRKLSKSTRATALRELRAQGVTPAQIRSKVGLD